MHVPLVDLHKQHAAIRAELKQAVERVIESQAFILGPEVAAFEAEIAQHLEVAHAIGVGCGSDALLLALIAAGVGQGDEVITSPFSFIATPEAIVRAGGVPVFADIEEDNFNMDPAQALDRITPRTRAMLPVHLFGRCARMEALMEAGTSGPIAVIEDAAQAMDAARFGNRAGALGHFACFSFFPSKNLGAWGDGGMVVTNNAAAAARIKRLRAHGSEKHYLSEELGLNSRLDALQAAVLRVKLRQLHEWSNARRDVAARYRALFAAHDLAEFVRCPPDDSEGVHVYNQFTLRADRRDALAAFLSAAGIGSAVYYPLPLHLQPCFSALGYKIGDFPIAEKASREVLSLPMHPFLEADEQLYVVETIRSFYCGAP